MIARSRVLLLLASASLSTLPACTGHDTGSAPSGARSVAATPPAAFQGALLDLAFEAASAFPIDPHLKNRSRDQEAVVAACLELGDHERARRFIPRIDNWRRGAAYADLAYDRALRGATTAEETAEIEHDLQLAGRIADEVVRSEDGQAWRRDRVRAKIARTYLVLGNDAAARQFADGVAASELGTVAAASATFVEASGFDEQVAAIDALLPTGSFEEVRNVLATCATLFDRFYDDADRRAALQARIERASAKLPVEVRIASLLDMTHSAVEHDDPARARELLAEADELVGSQTWSPEHQVPLMARLAAVRFEAGDEQIARDQLRDALVLFDASRERIVDMFRAGALRPLAEAYHAIGDTETALQLYARAIEEGVANPNSRPRADDLVATCCSLAVRGVEPPAALQARLTQIGEGLGTPW